MPKITNPVTLDKIRAAILEGKNDSDIMRAAGFSQSMIKHKSRDKIVSIQVEKSRIKKEIDKEGLANKAWKRLEKNLNAKKETVQTTAAIAILDFTEGKKSEVTTINPDDKTKVDGYLSGIRLT
jgi:hypothetical protein